MIQLSDKLGSSPFVIVYCGGSYWLMGPSLNCVRIHFCVDHCSEEQRWLIVSTLGTDPLLSLSFPFDPKMATCAFFQLLRLLGSLLFSPTRVKKKGARAGANTSAIVDRLWAPSRSAGSSSRWGLVVCCVWWWWWRRLFLEYLPIFIFHFIFALSFLLFSSSVAKTKDSESGHMCPRARASVSTTNPLVGLPPSLLCPLLVLSFLYFPHVPVGCVSCYIIPSDLHGIYIRWSLSVR